jgi:Tol biopolymer transport system component
VPVSGSPVEMAGFIAVPAFMDRPRLSPDGVNVAYLSPNGANTDVYLNGFYIGNEILTSCAANTCGLTGWAPDSATVVFWADNPRSLWYQGLSMVSSTHLTDTANAENVRWVDSSRFLFLSDGELRLGTPGGASSYLDSPVDGEYDYYGFLP